MQQQNNTGGFLKEAIFGINDGVVSMLALVASLTAASISNNIIIIAGLAEMFAGAISMGIGSYISTKSKMEFIQRQLQSEDRSIEKNPKTEKKHLIDIYKKKGFKGKELTNVVNKIMSNKKVWKDVMQREELGYSTKVLENPAQGGVVMFCAFLIASFIPLIPFFTQPISEIALLAGIFNGIILLFIVGLGKAHYTGRNKITSAFEMVFVGSIATVLAYGIGHYINALL
jgi:vacuolar iron transporter family protein